MDSSGEEEQFYDAFDEIQNEEGSYPATLQSDYVPPPDVTVLHVDSETVSLGVAPIKSSLECKLHVNYFSDRQRGRVIEKESGTVDIEKLTPGTKYKFSITREADNENHSKATTLSVCTEPSPPMQIKIIHVSSDSVTLQWEPPAGEVQSYIVTCNKDGERIQHLETDINNLTIRNLRPGVCYSVQVSTQLKNGVRSKPAVTYTRTKTHLRSLLVDLGLAAHFREKLSLSSILQIDERTTTDESAKCNVDIALLFLKKIMMVNVTARTVKESSIRHLDFNVKSGNTKLELKDLIVSPVSGETLNPLDIITALFLCSDGFVQQELTLKMSMCQFSVPLLLPNCDTQQCTLMLWAMRDIVKKYRPHSLSESKGFKEDRIVVSELPMISFVRLGECSLSKSETLNKILSSSQQYHDTFVHHNMECGDSPRRISNGLVEISWYLPCGNQNIDIFSEPVAVANLRGDAASFETQYSFLCQTSAAVFVFFDSLSVGCRFLTNQHNRVKIFLVGDQRSETFSLDNLQKVAINLKLTNSNIMLKTKHMNDADFIKWLRETVKHVLVQSKMKMTIEQMADVAHELGIMVDEDCPECQTAKRNADAITAEIQDILQYKEAQLPLQGQIWKELTMLEKEEFRLTQLGSKNIDLYKSDLIKQKKKLREKQNSSDMSDAMTCFVNAISSSETERCYFLKWMRMNLDNLSRDKLSHLRELYKHKCETSENQEEIKNIDKQLSSSSLGTEHFFREMGQIYEASVCLSETNQSRQQLQHLPKLCAQLLLDGFPVELVDGDASNIPLRWVSDVLSQLNELVSPKNKVLVVTVLGVQSTGKSTLLNTMFGVQFAVSSGRCTRGAFMLLIRINEDVKTVLNCDFMVIIDTEGLKSPELAQLDNSYEHDNELATLVVGLSDITIVNIAMENITDMKDILQIVVHAFLRMKEIGKKPKCQFVHQNVSDVSAHEKNLRDRKLLLQQLNEMTQAAARMENKEKYKSFTDVMDYDPDTGNWYIPGLWNGNPPMAPVNAGYSEAVYDLKKNVIRLLGNHQSSGNNIMEFTEWMRSLWTAIKHENFIFSFKNSLVADAYMKLCTEFNKWEWEFKKDLYTWVTQAQIKISNFGTVAAKFELFDIKELLTSLKTEASTKLTDWEKKLLDNLTQYFKQTEGHVYLVEGYREEFLNTAKTFRREMENSVVNQLTAAAEIKQGMREVDKIKENHTKELEKAVSSLIDECRTKNIQMTDEELDKEFDKMWKQTMSKLTFSKLKPQNIFTSVSNCLRQNLSHRGSHACELLSQRRLEDCGNETYKITVEGFWNQTVHKMSRLVNYEDHVMLLQKMADNIINVCKQAVEEKMLKKRNYHETDIQEILHLIDEKLRTNQDVDTDIKFDVSLKQHICGFVAKSFQLMHNGFLELNDPHTSLNQNKDKFCADFKDLFHERDQCQKKAEEFTNRCLKPAVEDFIKRSLGPDIIGEMMTIQPFSTRMLFQFSVLKDLLEKNKFETYYNYISSYEDYVKNWIFDQVVSHFSDGSKMSEFEDQRLQSTINSINVAINKAKTRKSIDLKTFVEDVCRELSDKLVISQDALGAFMILNNAEKDQFAHWLTESVEAMAQTLKESFKKLDTEVKLKRLHVKPQNELFTKLIGCGKQCPFCKSPCEAGGKKHTVHFASLHQPQGLSRYNWESTRKLVTNICSSMVVSEKCFFCPSTNFEWHPYKRYNEIFPDWKISPDESIEASGYWKYVMARFNKDFAKEYQTNPADIPDTWFKITPKQAEDSLKESFNIK